MNLNLKALARKVIALINHGLIGGLGEPKPGEMCVEAAICYALEETHGDEPSCVDSRIRDFKIALNDCNWSSNMARARGLKRLAIASLGSDRLLLNHYQDERRKFNSHVYLRTVNVIPPQLLRMLWHPEECVRNDYEILARECETVKEAVAARELMRNMRKQMEDHQDGVSDKVCNQMERFESFAANMTGDMNAQAAAAAMNALGGDERPPFSVRAYDAMLMEVANFAVEGLQKVESPGCEHLNLIKS